jgi:hypothetical protein
MIDPSESARISALEQQLSALNTHVSNLITRADRAEAKLDSHFERIGNASERIVRLDERIVHLPSKGLVYTAAVGIVSAVILLFTFFGTIQSWLGHVPQH